MSKWIHERAEHLLAKNPDMKKSTAFAVATQQAESTGHTPKGFGTPEGKHTAKAKYDTPKNDVPKANPGNLETPKLKAATWAGFTDELEKIAAPKGLGRIKQLLTGSRGMSSTDYRRLMDAQSVIHKQRGFTHKATVTAAHHQSFVDAHRHQAAVEKASVQAARAGAGVVGAAGALAGGSALQHALKKKE